MIERAGKNIRAPSCPTSPSSNGAARWVAAIFVLSVSLAIPPLPRAFGQPGSDADNQTKQGLPGAKVPPVQRSNATTRPQTAEGHQGQLLRYDVRPKLSASQLPGDSITLKTCSLIPRCLKLQISIGFAHPNLQGPVPQRLPNQQARRWLRVH